MVGNVNAVAKLRLYFLASITLKSADLKEKLRTFLDGWLLKDFLLDSKFFVVTVTGANILTGLVLIRVCLLKIELLLHLLEFIHPLVCG
jgi:hypothetical protein